jgi:hypothetical protein
VLSKLLTTNHGNLLVAILGNSFHELGVGYPSIILLCTTGSIEASQQSADPKQIKWWRERAWYASSRGTSVTDIQLLYMGFNSCLVYGLAT